MGVVKMYNLHTRLKELRKKYNISQNSLANQLNLTRATINAWEMGISYPNAQSLILLSHFFKVSVDYLLGIENRETIDIGHLNNTEKNMIFEMVNYLSNLKED